VVPNNCAYLLLQSGRLPRTIGLVMQFGHYTWVIGTAVISFQFVGVGVRLHSSLYHMLSS